MVKILNHILWFLIALFLLYAILILSACNIAKAKKTIASDSTRTSVIDSGSLRKNTVNEKTTADWERQILIYNSKDTTINHYYSGTTPALSIDYNRLAAIITERGNYNNEKQTGTVDSNWKKAVDSLGVIVRQSTKQKTEKGLTLWQIIGITVGVSLSFSILEKIVMIAIRKKDNSVNQ